MINQITLVGRLTKDPELRYTSDGVAVSNVTVALNRHFKNSDGEYTADFIPCTIWNKVAENTVQYCRKGSIVGVTGRLQSRYYDDSDGKRVYVTEVVAENVKFMDFKKVHAENQSSQSIQA